MLQFKTKIFFLRISIRNIISTLQITLCGMAVVFFSQPFLSFSTINDFLWGNLKFIVTCNTNSRQTKYRLLSFRGTFCEIFWKFGKSHDVNVTPRLTDARHFILSILELFLSDLRHELNRDRVQRLFTYRISELKFRKLGEVRACVCVCIWVCVCVCVCMCLCECVSLLGVYYNLFVFYFDFKVILFETNWNFKIGNGLF